MRFWYLIGGGSGAEASGTNRRVLSLITYFGEIYRTLCLMIIVDTSGYFLEKNLVYPLFD